MRMCKRNRMVSSKVAGFCLSTSLLDVCSFTDISMLDSDDHQRGRSRSPKMLSIALETLRGEDYIATIVFIPQG